MPYHPEIDAGTQLRELIGQYDSKRQTGVKQA
jgi:hypothetical protein